MKRVILCMLLMTGPATGAASTASSGTGYQDVGVIINVNSAASQAIGAYFAQARGIPAANMIHVNVASTEEIDAAEFASLRSQVESHLQANGLTASLNYLVTTKGVPLKVNRGDTYSTSSPSASVESELMLVLGSYASLIGGNGKAYSPYYGKTAAFSRATHGIYLVTRLDGFSTEDVLTLIDRSGPGTKVSSASRFVFDQDPAWNSAAPYLNDQLAQARTALQDRGRIVELNSDTVFVTERHDVIGYASWGSNDHYHASFTDNAIPGNTWVPGSLAETYVSTSGRSFEDPPDYGQSLIADLIREGASGAKGYVYEPYSSAMANAAVLFDRYTGGFNLAESYFMASRYISWMDVVVGDPKTSVTFVDGLLPVQLSSFSGSWDEQAGAIQLRWTTLSELNNYGFILQRYVNGSYEDIPGTFVAGHGTTLESHNYSATVTAADAAPADAAVDAPWQIRLKQTDLDGTEYFSDAIIVERPAGATGVDGQEPLPGRFALEQNYPNPFNPSTTIRYALPEAGAVRLVVYNGIGQEVAVLADGRQDAGVHEVSFAPGGNGPSAASGVYYYRLVAGQRQETRTMVYVK